jgi:CheY-like chemotaxis protein
MASDRKTIVLVAEDHPVNQKVACLLLQAMNVESIVAEDGSVAVKLYQSNRPDLILMDIMMPVMDGFHASKEIRKIEFGKEIHTPIIACTALERDKIMDEAISCGIDDYIGKPFSRELLIRKVEHWAGIKTQEKKLSQGEQAFVKSATSKQENESQETRLLHGLEQLDDILALFLTVTETLLAQLDSAIQTQDLASVRRIAHEIKSGSYAVDAKEIASICLQLEQIENNWPEVVKTYPALALAFAKVRELIVKKQQSGVSMVGLQ